MRRETIKNRQGSWRQGGAGDREPHLRGVYIQWKQVFLGYAAWIFIMPLYSSLLNFNHFTHIRQTTSWCQNQRVLLALQSRGKIQRVEFHWEREKERKAPNQLKASVQSNPYLFVTFHHFKTQTFPDRIKAQLLHVDGKSYFRIQACPSTGEGELFPRRKMIDF